MKLSLASLTFLGGFLLGAEAYPEQCRCFPGEACWPSQQDWSSFNKTLGGRLIRPALLGQPCHDPHYDAEKCKAIQKEWTIADIHLDTPNSPTLPWFSNMTCDPLALPRQAPCKRGNEVEYAVNVTKPEHVSATLKFAKQNNIRVVLRNTGHDLLGKSVGAGGIAIWMHHLKDIKIKDYTSQSYSGKAIKMQAGIQGKDLYPFAFKHNREVVGGSCPTVGVAGGYTQGGGHSPLSSNHGLGADQVLEWEVIDGNGKMQIATPRRNKDLYWALSGGGGGTYGIVWSLTVKTYPATPVSHANMTILADGVSKDTYYTAVEKFFTVLPSLIDAPATCGWTLTNSTFILGPVTAPNIPVKHLKGLLKPYTDYLKKAGIKHVEEAHQYDNFVDYIHDNAASNVGQDGHLGSWLIPRSVVQDKARNAEFRTAWEYVAETGGMVTASSFNASKPAEQGVDNAVLPAMRQAASHAMVYSPISPSDPKVVADEAQIIVTDDYIPRFMAIAPESGAYLNEADSNQKNFKEAFYGKNYNRLHEIKKKYDPEHIFYANTAVGSDEWVQHEDGHLCRKSQK